MRYRASWLLVLLVGCDTAEDPAAPDAAVADAAPVECGPGRLAVEVVDPWGRPVPGATLAGIEGEPRFPGETYALTESLDPATRDLTCRVASTALPMPVSLAGSDNAFDTGFIGLRVQYVAASFPYVVVFAIPQG